MSILFRGGNSYISGDDNIVSGSMYLSAYSGSGIHLYGSPSGSALQSSGFSGILSASKNVTSTSSFGWGLITQNPHNQSIPVTASSVQMINQHGSVFDFGSAPSVFNLFAIGKNARFITGRSGSTSTIGTGGMGSGSFDPGQESFVKWNGAVVQMRGVQDELGVAYVSQKKFTQTFGDGVILAFTFTHTLNTTSVHVNVRDIVTGQLYYPLAVAAGFTDYTAVVSSTTAVTVTFANAPATNQFSVLITG